MSVPTTPRAVRRRRLTNVILGGFALLVVAGVLAASRRSGATAWYEGRSPAAWFHELLRVRDCFNPRRLGEDQVRWYRARTALLELGTNSIPVLVERASDVREDGRLRGLATAVFRVLPEWAGRGAFASRWQTREIAQGLLRDLRPPAEALLPAIEAGWRSADPELRLIGLRLLGSVGSGRERGLPWILAGIGSTNRVSSREWYHAFEALEQVDADPAVALPAVLGALRSVSFTPPTSLHVWLRRHGPAAAAAVPELERRLADTNLLDRLTAAVTVLHLQPGHAVALREVTEAAATNQSPFSMVPPIPPSRHTLCRAARLAERTGPCPDLVPLMETMARAEIRDWKNLGERWVATAALEQVAEDRAIALYREALTGPRATIAAGCLLRLERTNAEAARVLARGVRQNELNRIELLNRLDEAASANREAMQILTQIAEEVDVDPRPAAAARSVLARIAWREYLEKRRLPPKP